MPRPLMAMPAFIGWLPLASAVVWTGLGAYQVARDRFRTWTEVLLVATFFLIGVYAFSEFLFYQSVQPGHAAFAIRLSLSFLVLAAACFLLYAVVLYSRMHRSLFLAFVPAIVLLPLVWTQAVAGVSAPPGGGPFDVDYHPLWIAAWSAYMVAYSLLGILAFYLTFRAVQRATVKLAARMRVLFAAILLTFVLGFATTSVLDLLNPSTPPLFSTLLAIPGVLAFVAVSPLGEGGFTLPIHRWKAHGYSIRAAFLTYRDGTLIGSRIRPEERMIDQDLLAGTLDVIQNFMRTSFPFLEGLWLQSISHGDYTLVLERARTTYLTVVLLGQETDQLRRLMRDGLRGFEDRNRQVLRNWRGVSDDAVGADALLARVMGETADDAPSATPSTPSGGNR